MKNVIWQGTVDLIDAQELGPLATAWPMRVTEDADGALMTEYASDEQIEDGRCVPNNSEWIADYQRNYRDPNPEFSPAMRKRMEVSGL